MVIDSHAHIWDRGWLPSWTWNLMFHMVSRRQKVSLEEAKKHWERSWDPSGDSIVRHMDQAGVDVVGLWACDWGLVPGMADAETPIEEINHLLYKATQRHSKRLFFGAGIDPRRKNAVQVLEKAVKEHGAKGLKLYPACGFYPADKIVYPLYEKCVELGIPVALHIGPHFGPMRSKYGQPINIDDVASDFPDLSIIAFHSGYEAYHELLYVAHHRPNVFSDLAGWHYWTVRPLRFYQTLRFLLDNMGSERIMFASDWGGHADIKTYVNWVKTFTLIPSSVREAGIQFTETEISNLLHGNASRIYKL